MKTACGHSLASCHTDVCFIDEYTSGELLRAVPDSLKDPVRAALAVVNESRHGGHGYLGQCEACDAKDPHWYIMRTGDVVVTWACDEHLSRVCERLQRDDNTELTVTVSRKGR